MEAQELFENIDPNEDPTSDAKPKTPVGVLLLEDGAEDASLEMNKLLRHPRYFDTDFEDTALRCFRCGGSGHMSRDCKNELRQKPCILCAQFGHMRNECPQGLWAAVGFILPGACSSAPSASLLQTPLLISFSVFAVTLSAMLQVQEAGAPVAGLLLQWQLAAHWALPTLWNSELPLLWLVRLPKVIRDAAWFPEAPRRRTPLSLRHSGRCYATTQSCLLDVWLDH
jgi:hypothetical protein